MNSKGKISRRGFLKTGIAVGAGVYGLPYLRAIKKKPTLKQLKEHDLKPGIVVVHGDSANANGEDVVVKEMVRRAISALGGMRKLVSNGDRYLSSQTLHGTSLRNLQPIQTPASLPRLLHYVKMQVPVR